MPVVSAASNLPPAADAMEAVKKSLLTSKIILLRSFLVECLEDEKFKKSSKHRAASKVLGKKCSQRVKNFSGGNKGKDKEFKIYIFVFFL